MVGLVNKPVINMESAANHPCQALADWKTLDDLGVPRKAKFVLSWVQPSARAAARGSRRRRCTWRRCAAWRWWCCGRKDSPLPEPIMQKARGRGRRFRRQPARDRRIRDEALAGAHVLYAKEWGSTAHYGNADADARARSALADWCVRDTWFSRSAVDCKLMHCLPVRRNVAVADEVLDGRRSVVQREAFNRMVVQTAVLHRLLSTPQHLTSSRTDSMIMHRPDPAAAIRSLRSAAPYIRMYKGKTFVVKAGGGVFADAARCAASSNRSPSCITSACAWCSCTAAVRSSPRSPKRSGVPTRMVQGRTRHRPEGHRCHLHGAQRPDQHQAAGRCAAR
jgi:hypothetical protein